MNKPMNPDVKPGVKVRNDEATGIYGITGEILPGTRTVRSQDDCMVADSVVLYAPPGNVIGCVPRDITPCFEVVNEPRKMTVVEAVDVMSEGAGCGKYDPWAIMLAAGLYGKEAVEKLLSEKLGYPVEIVKEDQS